VFLTTAQAEQEESIEERAAQYYQNEQWKDAADTYRQVTKNQPDNYTAWYRLGNALIELKEAKQALLALDEATKSAQIPASQIAYQRAQAYRIAENDSLMWESLQKASESGYANLQVIERASIWDPLRDEVRFKSILTLVEKNAHPCLHDSRFSEFDFWLGKWSVYGNTEKTGPLYGNNQIKKEQDGCLIMEYWNGASGTTGTSMNYYDGTKDKWVQHWVSVGGITINAEGGLVDGSMKLQGKIYYLSTPGAQIRDFRAMWTPLEKGVVRQFFEESIDGGETWYTWFEGFYFPE
jgi:hypothetical protein